MGRMFSLYFCGGPPPLEEPGQRYEPSVHQQNMDYAAKRASVDQGQHPEADEQEHNCPRHGNGLFLCSRQLSTKRTMLKKARTGHDFALATFRWTGVCIGRLCFSTS